jgi:hypothetical protein
MKTSPQRASTADPVLAGAVSQTGAVLKIKATINIGKIKSSFGLQNFFPCGGMAVVKSFTLRK